MAAAVASLTDALRDVLLPIVYLSRVESRIINSYIKITLTGMHLIGVSTAAHAARQHSIHLLCLFIHFIYRMPHALHLCSPTHKKATHTQGRDTQAHGQSPVQGQEARRAMKGEAQYRGPQPMRLIHDRNGRHKTEPRFGVCRRRHGFGVGTCARCVRLAWKPLPARTE